jgi:flagellar protein FliJ
MLRSERLEPVLDIASSNERCAVEALAGGEARVIEAEQKLAELERYAQEYRSALHAKTQAGIDATQLRAFHAFISRLGDAVAQQGAILVRAREERDRLRQHWIETSRRTQAVGKVIEHACVEERRIVERREQHENDERAQRTFATAALAQREGNHDTRRREES